MPPRNYKPYLIRLMNHADNTQYVPQHEFSEERLAQLTPDHVLRFMNKETFGVEHPTDDAPPQIRSSSLKYMKKAISAFMVNKMMVWNEIANVGNPTRSTKINDLIKRVKKAEVRQVGAPSRAARPLTLDEDKRSLSSLQMKEDDICKYGLIASNAFQFHYIARIDDTTQVKVNNIAHNPQHPFTLKCKLRWSKNVLEERDKL